MKQIVFSLLLMISFVCLSQQKSFEEFKYKCKDGKTRPYIVYTPPYTKSTQPKTLLVYLHGAISNTNLKKDPLAYIKKSELIKLADQGNFNLMFCYGQKGATWFDTIGIDMVLQEIKEVTQKYKIDKNKIFLSGFSDGGSGVLHFSMTNHFPFAGFIAMNGSIKVAQKISNSNLFPENSNQKPIYIINTTKDALYPLNQIKPTIEYLKKFNHNVIFKTPNGNHETSYLKNETKNILNFIKETKKQNKNYFSWEVTDTKTKLAINWLKITKLDSTAKPKKWHKPYTLKVFNNKARFGLKYDYTYQGKGLKIKSFKNDTCTAKKMGIKKDDVVIMMEKDSIKSAYDPYFYVAKKKATDSTEVTLLRNNKKLTLKGKFNPGYYYSVFKEDKKSGKIKVTIQKDQVFIETSKIHELEVDFKKLQELNIKKITINKKDYTTKPHEIKKIQTN